MTRRHTRYLLRQQVAQKAGSIPRAVEIRRPYLTPLSAAFCAWMAALAVPGALWLAGLPIPAAFSLAALGIVGMAYTERP